MCAWTFIISETMKNELYPLIYSETYHPDSPHLILFYNTGCLCLCLHWLQIIVMHRVWVVVWNVKCNSISAQWFCVVEGLVVLWMRVERSAASLKQFLIHIILTLKQDYFITTSSTATKTTLDLPIAVLWYSIIFLWYIKHQRYSINFCLS